MPDSELLSRAADNLQIALERRDGRPTPADQLAGFFAKSPDGFFFMTLEQPIEWREDHAEEILERVFATQRLTHANAAMLAQYRAESEDFLGCTPADFFVHDIEQGKRAWREMFEKGFLRTRTCERRFDGTEFWVEGTYVTLRDAEGRIVGHFGSQRDVSEEMATLEALRHSEARLEEAQRIAGIGHWDWNILNNDLHWSNGTYRILGLEPKDGVANYEDFVSATHPDDREAAAAAVAAALGGAPYSFEHRIVRPSGEVRWVQERGEVFFDEEDHPVRMLGTALDITERKRIEMELRQSLHDKEVLLREVHHRVKNNLQIISSLLYFQAKRVHDPRDLAAFEDGRKRLSSMILVHEKLYQTGEFSRVEFRDYLQSLISTLTDSFDDRRVRVELCSDDIRLPVEFALPLGMIVCELVTNTFKHAFDGRPDGRLSISVRRERADVVAEVEDDGVGFPPDFDSADSDSFGWQLVHGLVEQINGTVEATNGTGAHVRVSFRNVRQAGAST
jgi:PAS domain S-box-containing protein